MEMAKDRHHRGMASATGRVKPPAISLKEEGRSPLGVGALSLARASDPETEEENAHGEEGTLSEWLHEVLGPHVEELVVAGVRKSRGPKSDKRDAFALAEQLRIGALETKVYKGRGKFRRLGSLARGHGLVVVDVVRVKNWLKSVLRSQGVGYGAGHSVWTGSGGSRPCPSRCSRWPSCCTPSTTRSWV